MSGVLLGLTLIVASTPVAAMDMLLPEDPAGELSRLRWATEGWDALRVPLSQHDEVELRAGLGNPGLWLEGGVGWWLEPRLLGRIWVAGTSADEGQALLGTHKQRAGWTGRILHGSLVWDTPGFQAEWGRRHPGAGEDRLRELTWPREAPAVDLLRALWRTRDGRLGLELTCAQLLSTTDPDLKRWYARHRLVWHPGGNPLLRLEAGDQVLFTGIQRGFDWQYLNPFIPFFLENFEGYETGSQGESADQDNSSLFFGWDARLQVSELVSLGCYGEFLVDEFQLDGADRDKLDDALGLTLGLDLRRGLAQERVLRLRWEGNAISHWTYVHRGEETSYLERGAVIGHAEGGDLVEHQLQLQLYRLAGRQELVSLTLGSLRKGSIEVGDAWDAESTKGEGWPSTPTKRTFRVRGAGSLELLPGWTLALEVERVTGHSDWTLRSRLGWHRLFTERPR